VTYATIRKEAERPGLRTVRKLMLGYACAAAGKQEEARGILWELDSKLASDDRWAFLLALLFTALGEKDRRSNSWSGPTGCGIPA
jgi:hypothetical protein